MVGYKDWNSTSPAEAGEAVCIENRIVEQEGTIIYSYGYSMKVLFIKRTFEQNIEPLFKLNGSFIHFMVPETCRYKIPYYVIYLNDI